MVIDAVLLNFTYNVFVNDTCVNYRIEQNFGGKIFWRNCDFETGGKFFGEFKACLHFHYSACTIALKSVNYKILYIASMRSIERSR